jgi:putative ABC transport system permease protein
MLRNYLKTAFRSLLKNKTFSFINIFGLMLGTLCCLYIVLYVGDQYSYDKHHREANDIYRITTYWTAQGNKNNWATVTGPVAPAMQQDFAEVKQYTRVVPALGIDRHLLRYQENAVYEKDAVYADATFFDLFAYHFDNGNATAALVKPNSVVLLKPVADKLFGKEDPVGKTITIDNVYGKNDFTVTAVIDESLGKSHIKANMFFSMNSGGLGSMVLNSKSWAGNNFVISYVKLQPHANVAALEKKLPAFLDKYGQEQLKNLGMSKELHLEPVTAVHITPGYKGVELSKPVNPFFLYVLLGIAGLIQLIACINFMNLSTARAAKRALEVGVRKVLGAGKADLVKQFLSESFLLSLLGVLFAIPLLILGLPLLNHITGANIDLGFLTDYRLWCMLGGLVLITGLVAGSYPAFYLSAFRAIKVIKGNFTNHVSAAGIRRSLVVFQFVLSIGLITGIIVIYSQLNYIKNKDLGFEKDQKLIFSFHTGDALDKMPAFMTDLRQLADINAVSKVNNLPGQLLLNDLHVFLQGGNITTAPDAGMIFSDEYFVKATGVKLLSGRDFRSGDSGKVIINESLAQQLNITPQSAPGTILHSESGNGKPLQFEITGVMKDFHYNSLHENVIPMFLAYSQDVGSQMIVSTNSNNYNSLLSKIEAVWHKDLPGVPFDYAFLDQEVQKQYEADISLSRIITSFTLMAILISCLGLFGLAAFSAEQRSKEIGIRKVLGASVAGIAQLLSKDFLKLVMIAFVIAAPLAGWAMHQWLQVFAYRVNVSWWMFALAGAIAALIALTTVSFQTIKAAIVNPAKSLKTQ